MKPVILFLLVSFVVLAFACGDEQEGKQSAGKNGEVAYSPDKDIAIQKYNIEEQKKQAAERFPCDTIAFKGIRSFKLSRRNILSRF